MTTSPAPTMTEIVTALETVYTPSGAAIWLRAQNAYFGGMTAISMCIDDEDRRKVAAVVDALASGAFA